MRSYRFDVLAITVSALDDLTPEEAEVLCARLADAARVTDIAFLGQTPERFAAWAWLDGERDPVRALRALQQFCGSTAEHTLVIGCDAADLVLAEHCALYLHVGEEAALGLSVRRVVPLWGQYGSGITNALDYFAEREFRDVAIEHGDIADFVGRSIRYYESPDATTAARRDHDAFCTGLMEDLGSEIAGIFAVGFPFYCLEPATSQRHARTPASILEYLNEQKAYFTSKLIDEAVYREHADLVFDATTAQTQLGLCLDRNHFDAYEYDSAGASPPPSPLAGTLRELLASTSFDVREDPWPCLHCVTLQAPDLYPSQRVAKDTNETCLRCRQTSLMLRNVTGCSVDLDAVIVVHEDARSAAERIKRHISEAGSHLYDLDLRRTILNVDDGPVDLFVTTVADLLEAFAELATPGWLAAEFPAVALWSLTLTDHRFNLGEDFPVAFEPQTPLDPALDRALCRARHAFARTNSAAQVIDALRAHSSARRQLVGNPEIVASIGKRLAWWRACGDAQPTHGG
jgi:hypothetical protein